MTWEAARERAAIVALLRVHTHLVALADLIEAGGHQFSQATLKAWCEKRELMIRAGAK